MSLGRLTNDFMGLLSLIIIIVVIISYYLYSTLSRYYGIFKNSQGISTLHRKSFSFIIYTHVDSSRLGHECEEYRIKYQ